MDAVSGAPAWSQETLEAQFLAGRLHVTLDEDELTLDHMRNLPVLRFTLKRRPAR